MKMKSIQNDLKNKLIHYECGTLVTRIQLCLARFGYTNSAIAWIFKEFYFYEIRGDMQVTENMGLFIIM